MKKIVLTAVFGASAGAVQVFENLALSAVALPGGKIGLANVLTMIILELLGIKYALAVTVLKSAIAFMASGSLTAFIYSVSGGVFAVVIMTLIRKIGKASQIGVGVAGAYANNCAQVFLGAVVTENIFVLSYIWVLGIVSVVSGIFTGITAEYTIKYLKGMINS